MTPIAQDPDTVSQRLPARLLEATVLDPPTDAHGWLRVEIAAQKGVAVSVPWQPRPDVVVSPGDAAALMESDEGNYWCVQWWPQAGLPLLTGPVPISDPAVAPIGDVAMNGHRITGLLDPSFAQDAATKHYVDVTSTAGSGGGGGGGSSVGAAIEPWHQVGATGEPAFQNGWVNYDTARPLEFKKYPDGRVRIQGIVKGGTVAATVFTLPAGYRPITTSTINFPITTNGVEGHVSIDGSSGIVVVQNGSNAWADLSSIEFDTGNSSWPGGAAQGAPLSRVRLTRSTTQALNQTTITAVAFDSAGETAGSPFWSPSAPDKITIPEDGYYAFSGNVYFNNTSGTHDLFLAQYGNSGNRYTEMTNGVAAVADYQAVNLIRWFPAGFQLALYAWQNSGSNTTMGMVSGAGNEHQCHLAITKLPSIEGGGNMSLASLPAVGVRVRRNADYVVPNPSGAIPWNSEDWDSDGFHDNTTNPSRLTVPPGKAGKYVVTLSLSIALASGGVRNISITKNGAGTGAETAVQPSTVDSTRLDCSTVLDLADGDYVEANHYHNTAAGGTQTVQSGWSQFSMVRIPGDITVVPQTTAIENWHYVGAAGEPAFQGSTSASSPPPRFRKDPAGQVYIEGLANATAGATIFTLPVGYRPSQQIRETTWTWSGSATFIGILRVDTNGNVMLESAGSTVASGSLGVQFAVDQSTWPQNTVIVGPQTPATGAKAKLAADTSIANAAWVTVPLASESYDSAGLHDNTVNPSRITIQQAGYYAIAANVCWDTNGTNYRGARLVLNGTTHLTNSEEWNAGSANFSQYALAAEEYLNAGDYIELQVLQNSGGALNLKAAAAGTTAGTSVAVARIPGAQGAALLPTLTLPSNPVDGQECYFLADAANGVIWHLKYRAGSASAYKWEFIGGGDLIDGINQETLKTVAATFTPTAFASPIDITLPLAGDYAIQASGNRIAKSTTLSSVYAYLAATAGTFDYHNSDGTYENMRAQFAAMPFAINDTLRAAAAAAHVTLKYGHGNTAMQVDYDSCVLRIRPVRVG